APLNHSPRERKSARGCQACPNFEDETERERPFLGRGREAGQSYFVGGAITAVACACTAPYTPFGTLPMLDVCSLGTMPRRSSAAARIWPRSSAYRIPWKPAMMLSLPSQHQPGFGLTSSSLISPLASARKSNRA